MPYLNWKERSTAHSMRPLPVGSHEGRSQMDLGFNAEEISLLVPHLEEIFLSGGFELRMDLSDGWTVFWKSRESGSRLLLAHPEHQEWVATVALELGLGVKLIERLKALKSEQSFSIHELGAESGIEFYSLGAVSNVEVRIKFK
jgi:hypothetical protein